MKVWEVDLKEVRFVSEVDETVKVEREVDRAFVLGLKHGYEDRKFVLVAKGRTTVVQLDFSGGYVNSYGGKFRRAAEDGILRFSNAIYEFLKSRFDWLKRYKDTESCVEIRVYQEPHTEVHQKIYYMPEFNIYFADFDTMFELGNAEVKLKQFDVLYAPRFVAKLLETYLQTF